MRQAIATVPAQRPGTVDVSAYLLTVLVLSVFLAAITVLSVVQPHGVTLTHSSLLNVAIIAASVVIALGVAYFALTEFLLYGVVSSLLVGLAFLLLAESSIGSGLLPVLGGWQRGVGAAQVMLAFERVLAGALLLVAATFHPRIAPARRLGPLVFAGFLITTLTALVCAIVPTITGGGAEPRFLQLALDVVAGVFFFAAAILFWETARVTRRAWFIWLAINLGIGAFAQIQYGFHPYRAGIVQPGDVLRLAFFAGILLALIGEWGRGFRALRSQTRELSVLHALMTAPDVRNVAQVISHATGLIGSALKADVDLLLPGRVSPARPGMEDLVTALESGDQATVVSFEEEESSRHGLATALQSDGRRLGTLVVARASGPPFSLGDVALLKALSAQTSLLLERSLLYEEVAAGAVLEERSRLAREIHDGLAQHLAFLKMRVAWLQRSPATLEVHQLRDIESVLATALTEARQAISTLRADSGATTTLDAIRGYAMEFSRLSSLELDITDNEAIPEVGPKARVELLRIVQESLNNVRKHSSATAVHIILNSDGGRVQICVQDNGKGFDTSLEAEGHFGTAIMRERAESIGGTLEIRSMPGGGTAVTVSVPVPVTDDRLTG